MKKTISLFAVLASCVAGAEMMDRPGGFKIGERMTIKPYVSLNYVYDSNADQQKHGQHVSSWEITPGFGAAYKGDNWGVDLSAFYRYTAYSRYVRSLNENSYGEDLKFYWANSAPDEKGWTLLFGEKYQKIAADDDMSENNGRGLWRDRETFLVSGAAERRFNERLHADVNANYYYLDYANRATKYANLYGWKRITVGAEAGYALSKWTDIIVAGNYMWYEQDNDKDRSGYSKYYDNSGHYSSKSKGYSVQGGIASRATERISYRALFGWTHFDYAGGVDKDNTPSYALSLNWKLSDTWNTMLLASRYYQPSERQFGTAVLVDAVSWGVAHSMIRGKLTSTLDFAYRHEDRTFSDASAYKYDEDIFSARFGLNYTLNRFITLFGRAEYQGCWFTGNAGNTDRDYDRFRGTLGFRLTY